MPVTRKTLYALRATYELARRGSGGPVKAAAIARAQGIPPRFLETILHELRQAGFVTSRRGARGGYKLAREPSALTVGEVIGFVQGPLAGSDAAPGEGGADASESSDHVFQPLWRQVGEAVAGVVDATSIQDLLDWEVERSGPDQPVSYVI
ncbi:RrF2 family transcriptional regulator [Candidatus Latescibacterota bacterium]